jgi:hypothetical protein
MAYTLIRSKEVVEEGSNVTITLINPELFDGTQVPYTIYGTGVTLSDFQGLPSLSNVFVMNGGRASTDLILSNDLTSEGTETVFVLLTGSNFGIGTTTSFFVADTSRTPTNVAPAIFTVIADKGVVEEGSNVTFTIRASNVASGAGTVVPYSIVGIQQEDIVETPLNGNLIFSLVGSELVSTLTLNIFLDFTVEGIETIVLLLNPSFPYTLEVATTVQILDTSVDTLPRIFLSRTPSIIYENGELDINAEFSRVVEVTLDTRNIPDGFSPRFKLSQAELGNKVTLDDFSSIAGITDFSVWANLDDFEYTFPPTVNGISRIELVARPDNRIEGNEYFFVLLPDYSVSTGLIQITDTTFLNGFLEEDDGIAEIRPSYPGLGSTGGFIDTTDVFPISGVQFNLLSEGRYPSRWVGSRGIISAPTFIQGRKLFAEETSAVYYQPFSYVIRSKISVDTWNKSIKDLVHPAGLASFGEINIDTDLDATPSIVSSLIGSLEISGSFTITIDDNRKNIRASNVSYSDRLFTLPLSADFTFITTDISV